MEEFRFIQGANALSILIKLLVWLPKHTLVKHMKCTEVARINSTTYSLHVPGMPRKGSPLNDKEKVPSLKDADLDTQ